MKINYKNQFKFSGFIRKFPLKKILPSIFIMLFLLSLFVNIFLYFKFKKERVMIIKPQISPQETFAEVPQQVKQLIRLPQDEQPQIFPITANTLRNQPFVKDAQNGDLLLLYLKNKKENLNTLVTAGSHPLLLSIKYCLFSECCRSLTFSLYCSFTFSHHFNYLPHLY